MMTKQKKRPTKCSKDKRTFTFLAVLTMIYGIAFVGTVIPHVVDKIKDGQRS